jgi:hypothetical protein
MKKPAIPTPSGLGDVERVLRPVRDTLEDITGVREGEFVALTSTATLADVITRLNAVTARLNRSGT